MFRRIIDKWRLKYLNNKIDKLLHDNDSKIGKRSRPSKQKNFLSIMLSPLVSVISLLHFPSVLIPIILMGIGILGFFKTSEASIFIGIILGALLCMILSIVTIDSYKFIKHRTQLQHKIYNRILGLNIVESAMNRWFVIPEYPNYDEPLISSCYQRLFYRRNDELFKDSEIFTDAEYGRLVKPILAYLKVCLTVDDGTEDELRKEFIKETNLDKFLNEMLERKLKRESELNELQADQDNKTKNKGIEEIKNVTRMIGMERPTEEVSESPEIKRLNNTIDSLMKTNDKFVTTIKKMESN